MTTNSLNRCWWVAVVAAFWGSAAFAMDAVTSTSQPTTAQAGAQVPPGFWPDLGWATVCWFAAVVILTLTVRLRPPWRVRNLDGLVLAGMCLLLGLREAGGSPAVGARSWQWWAHLGLTVAAAYWLVRGIGLLLARKPVRHPGTVPRGVRLVLVAAGLALSIHQLVTAPISPGSRDGIVGGLFTASTGKLSYGDAAAFERRSPLLYLVHAGAVRLVEPTLETPETGVSRAMTWENRELWLAEPWLESADLVAARLVNAALFVAMLAGLYLVGSRLHSTASGWIMVALFCVFPGTLECLAQPDIMLPAMLLTWTLAFALLPGVGGVLGTLCLVLAGVAWPWAWLGLPVLLAYFWRHGWQVLGSSVGLIGGVAACLFGLSGLVEPTIPRAAGALAMAGLQPAYEARLVDDGTLVIDRRDVPDEEIESQAVSLYLWRPLVKSESVALKHADGASDAVKIDWPNGVNGREVLYRQLAPSDEALPLLQTNYREAVGRLPALTRLLVGARTVMEATWLPVCYQEPPMTGSWRLWGGPPPMEARWILIRRMVKLLAALLVVWAALVVFFGRRARPRHLVGALLMAGSAAVVASELGAVTYLVWLIPLVATLWALHEPPEEQAPSPATASHETPFPRGDPPRVSVDAQGAEPPR